MGQQHGDKETGNNPEAALDLFGISTEDADDNVRDQAECDAVGDIIGKGHHNQGQERGDGSFQATL